MTDVSRASSASLARHAPARERASRFSAHKLRFTLSCYGLLFLPLALLTVFIYYPVVSAFRGAFFEFEVGAPARFVGLANFIEFLRHDFITWSSMGHMLFLTLFGVVVSLTIPLVVAKLIHSLPNDRARYLYRIIFLVPIVVPGVAVQLIWSGMIYNDRGMLNELLRVIGLADWTRGWLSDPAIALYAVAFAGFPFVSGFNVLIYYAGLANIPVSVNEAARLEGCVGLRKFLQIDIPLLMSQLKLILILTIIGGVQGWEGMFILTRGGPGFETMVPGLYMYYNAFSFQRMGYACAIGVCLFVIIFGLTVLNMRYFKSTEELEGR